MTNKEYYKEALIETDILFKNKNYHIFMCNILEKLYNIHNKNITFNKIDVKLKFPELFKYKPKNSFTEYVWFDLDIIGAKKRIEILKKLSE